MHRHTGQHPFGGSNQVLPVFVTRSRQGEKNNNEQLKSLLFDGCTVLPDERLFCYHTRNVSQADGYVFRSVTQLVKQMICLVPE